MAYPNTSAQDIAEKQDEIDQLRALLMEYFHAAQSYVSMEHQTPKEETSHFEQMLDLIGRTEEMMIGWDDESSEQADTSIPQEDEGTYANYLDEKRRALEQIDGLRRGMGLDL